MDDKWTAFMRWCNENPFCTIERLEIVNGTPNLIIVKKQLTQLTTASIKIKYNKYDGNFTKD